MALPFLAALGGGGGGGLSFDGGSAGPAKSGDVSNGAISFGGINTGTQSPIPTWAIAALVVVAAVFVLRKR